MRIRALLLALTLLLTAAVAYRTLDSITPLQLFYFQTERLQ